MNIHYHKDTGEIQQWDTGSYMAHIQSHFPDHEVVYIDDDGASLRIDMSKHKMDVATGQLVDKTPEEQEAHKAKILGLGGVV